MSMGWVSETKECPLEGEIVGARAESADASEGEIGEERRAAKVLARLGPAQVDFDERKGDGEKGVAEDDARVREAPGVENPDRGLGGSVAVEEVDESSLVVALEGKKRVAGRPRPRLEAEDDRFKSLGAVKGGLAPAEEIEIRSVDEENGGHRTAEDPRDKRDRTTLKESNIAFLLRSYMIGRRSS
jgi:hypothetical protein